MLFIKRETKKEKLNNLINLINLLESKEIKFSLVYTIDDDLTLTISDLNSVRVTKKELKETTKESKKKAE